MNLCLLDYNGESVKSMLQCADVVVSVNANGDVAAEIECDAKEYFKGGIQLDDTVEIPYPAFRDAQLFRIRRIDTEDSVMTLTAYHISHDFENGYCSTDNLETNLTLQNFVSQITYGANRTIRNNRDVIFRFYQHSTSDTRYSDVHQFTMPTKMTDKIIEHIQVIYGCNLIRDGKTIVLTYGTASDYFRNKYSMPEYSAILRTGRNIESLTTSADNTDIVTYIYPYTTIQDVNGNDMIVRTSGVKPEGLTNDVAKRHLMSKEYQSDYSYEAGGSWSDYFANVKADIISQAQKEVDAMADISQNISIGTIDLQKEIIFGGETVIIAVPVLECDFTAKIVSFKFDVIRRTFEDIDIGRESLKLSDLGKLKKGTKK